LKINYRLVKIDLFSIIVSLLASLERGGEGSGPVHQHFIDNYHITRQCDGKAYLFLLHAS